jgi:hypothetical protein
MKSKLFQSITAKRLALFIIILTATAFLQPAKSQPSVSVNIGLQPLWGPVGYDYVDYYYFPSHEVYYYVPNRQFVYLDGGNWRFASALPSRFGSINYYSTYKVVVNEPKAYLKYKTHKVKYVGGGKQVVIRDSPDAKYYVVKGHPHYNGGGKKSAVPANSGNSGNVKSSPSKSHSSGNQKASPAPKGNQGGGGKPSGGGKSSGGGNGKGGGKH